MYLESIVFDFKKVSNLTVYIVSGFKYASAETIHVITEPTADIMLAIYNKTTIVVVPNEGSSSNEL